MADRVFKYSVHFPEKSSPNEEDEKNSFEVIDKSEAEELTPVVVLLGWAGCREKHLQKYSWMYEKKGYITVKLMVSAQTLFFNPNKVVMVAEGLLDVLVKNNFTNNPIIFHMFSNGGSMVYSQLVTLLHSPGSEINLFVRGMIFDSTPGKPRPLNAVKGFISSISFGFVFRYTLALCLLLYLYLSYFLHQLLPVDLGAGTGFRMYDTICSDPSRCPQLFIYSRADKIILAEDVMEVIETRKRKGIVVKSICFDDSGHVNHLLKHPEVYAKHCLDFVDACLAPEKAKL